MSALCLPQHFVLLTPRASEEPQRIRLDQRSLWQHLRAHQRLTAWHRKPCTSTDEANSSAEREQPDQHGANQPRQRGEMFISGTKLTELHSSRSPRQVFFPTAQRRFASSLRATAHSVSHICLLLPLLQGEICPTRRQPCCQPQPLSSPFLTCHLTQLFTKAPI